MAVRRSRAKAKPDAVQLEPPAPGAGEVCQPGPLERVVRYEFGRLDAVDGKLWGSRAELAFALAAAIDDPGTSATARAQSAGRLHELLDRVDALRPVVERPEGAVAKLRGKPAARLRVVK